MPSFGAAAEYARIQTAIDNIPLYEVLAIAQETTNFLSAFSHAQLTGTGNKPDRKTFFAAIIGLGCNIGIYKIGKISTSINQSALERVVNWIPAFAASRIVPVNSRNRLHFSVFSIGMFQKGHQFLILLLVFVLLLFQNKMVCFYNFLSIAQFVG